MAALVHLAVILASLLIYAIGTHAGGQRRHPAAALAWVLTIALLPYVGLPLYFLLGTRKFVRPARRRHPVPELPATLPPDDARAWAVATLAGMGLAPPTAQAAIAFHEDGRAAWHELLALVDGAERTLDICTYVLGGGPVGRAVADRLAQRAAAGVQVRLLIDTVGSWRTPLSLVRRLRAAGVQVRWFMPLLHNPRRGRLNLRNHRKLAIADGQWLWSGGRNLAAEYFEDQPTAPPAWDDLSFTLQGPLASQSVAMFEALWQFNAAPHTLPPAGPPPTPQPGWVDAPHLAQLVPSGPDQAQDTVYELLLTAVFRARRRVLAVTPYLVPDDSLLTALCLAARRGIEVDLLIPARSNHRLADVARARALRELAAAGARIWLAPKMNHAKAVVVDDTLALCGSLNLDARSLFLNFELMVAFYAAPDIAALARWIEQRLLPGCRHAPHRPSLLRDIAEGLVRWVGFQI